MSQTDGVRLRDSALKVLELDDISVNNDAGLVPSMAGFTDSREINCKPRGLSNVRELNWFVLDVYRWIRPLGKVSSLAKAHTALLP